VLEAQQRGQNLVEFVLGTTRLLDRVRGKINARQEKALLRVMREGSRGFEGGLSAGNYQSITGARTATTTRDLADLVDKGVLVRTGERRYARYQLAVARREATRVTVTESGEVLVGDDEDHGLL
jgi:Fic family protein